MLKYLVLFFCFFVSVAQSKLLGTQEFYLDNGLHTIVIPNHKAPVIKLMLWYKVGSVDEPVGKGGLAHLLEHLMFRGTKKVKGSSFNDIIEAHGGESNAFTSHDFTVFHEFLDISRLEVALALEADRMQNLDISDEAFLTEQKIVFQERKQRISNSPFSRFGEVLDNTLWQNNPYSESIIGSEEEIKSLTKEDVVNFYNAYYSPDNAVLVLSGDIDLQSAKKIVHKYFAKIKPSKNKLKKADFDDMEKISFEVKQQMPEIKQERYVNKYVIPNFAKNIKHTFALMLFSNYYGETDNSYLQRNYVLNNKLLSAQSSYSAFRRGQGVFSVSAVPNDNKTDTAKLIEKSVTEALQSFTQEKLEEEKKKVLSSLVYLQDDPEDAAYIAGQFVALGFGIDEIENYKQYITDVELKDVVDAVNNMLKKSANISAFLQPMEQGNVNE